MRFGVIPVILLLAAGPAVSMTIAAEVTIPEIHIPTGNPEAVIYGIVERMYACAEVLVGAQIVDPDGRFQIYFYLSPRENAKPSFSIEGILILTVSPNGVSSAGSSISALGYYQEDFELLYDQWIRERLEQLLKGE